MSEVWRPRPAQEEEAQPEVELIDQLNALLSRFAAEFNRASFLPASYKEERDARQAEMVRVLLTYIPQIRDLVSQSKEVTEAMDSWALSGEENCGEAKWMLSQAGIISDWALGYVFLYGVEEPVKNEVEKELALKSRKQRRLLGDGETEL